MARAIGGDVVLRLMTSVADLKGSLVDQGEQIDEIIGNLKLLSATVRTSVRHTGRVATLLADFVEQHDKDYGELEARVDKLEQKTSGK